MKASRLSAAAAVLMASLAVMLPAGAGSTASGGPDQSDDAAPHWTAARIAAATPRDLVLDTRGLAYLRRPDGSLRPYGHSTDQIFAAPGPVSRPAPGAKPGGGGGKPGGGGGGGSTASNTSITNLDPAAGDEIGASHTFSATVTDPEGVRSVSFVIIAPSGSKQSFAAAADGNVWSASLQGFTDGAWSWQLVVRDGARKGQTTTSIPTSFTVSTAPSGGDTDVVSSPWTSGGTVQSAAGRIYFEMPDAKSASGWAGYVCSGTVAEDATSGRSIIITAAHCVYDDVAKAFARNVIFIPDQAATTGTRTDRDCTNDRLGCWSTSFGVVDDDWASRTFPANIPWDYAYYVVDDAGAHAGTPVSTDVLDVAAGDLPVQLSAPTTGAFTHALGYSYSEDPSFMYCAEALATERSYGDWWLSQCGLSGGSSGGPWLQPVSAGEGPIISVNSWGYTNQPGMAGPVLSGSSAECLFNVAKAQPAETVTARGVTAC